MVLACLLCLAELGYFFVNVGNLNVWNAWRVVLVLSLVGWLLLRGVKAVRELKSMSLPVRLYPEQASKRAPEGPASQSFRV